MAYDATEKRASAERYMELGRAAAANRLSAARRYFGAALSLYQETGTGHGEANAQNGLGELERRAGNIEAARVRYDAALRICVETGTRLGEANALEGLGDVDFWFRSLDAAQIRFEAALGIYVEIGTRLGEANARSRLADIEFEAWDLDAARTHHEDALAIYLEIGSRLGEANCGYGLARVDRRAGDLDAARLHYEAALAIYLEAGSGQDEANCRYLLGDLEEVINNFDAARTRYREALEIYVEIGDRVGEGNAHLSLGNVARSSGDMATAWSEYHAALVIYERLSHVHGQAGALLALGGVDLSENRPERARGYYDAALAIYLRLADRMGEASARLGFARLEDSEGHVVAGLLHAHAAVRALEHVRGGLGSEAARHRFHLEHRSVYDLGLDLAGRAIRNGDTAAGDIAVEIAEAARAGSFAELVRAGGFPVDDDLRDLVAELARLETSLLLQAPDLGTPEAAGTRTGGVVAELDRLHQKLAGKVSGTFATVLRPGRPDVEAIKASLAKEGTHGLLYHLPKEEDRRSGHVVWISPTGEVSVEGVALGHELATFVERFADGNVDELVLENPTTWEQLGESLLPARLRRELLAADEPLPIVVVPDEIVWSLPMCALRLAGAPLVTRALVRTVPSLGLFSALVAAESRAGVEGTLCYFDEVLSTGNERSALELLGAPYSPVAHARDPGEILDALATPLALWAMGTHGTDEEGLRQSFHLSDDVRLSAGSLLGRTTPPVVSLGSCYGARMPLGFAAVCLSQGTRTLLGPITLASPLAGSVLADTYRRLATTSPADALRKAQLARLAADPSSPPSDWAVLAAVGV